ncbi:NADPH-dependent 2,4-dienoyl-CoA reductase [Streptomyces kronopolitis]|uniref:NADPH-dependent 2,4-dienoyl-CoA reductase n=1 Tax=Streptomyces kronopolitis TaxID=1612435 RepID=A0ABQ2JL45_9ACTN|nr:FAD-dependent oxidoreductase [Streptomyces kronopolitis]GGN49046.1 NADPH-dependent 2,4-dienoyl-CoA reductase [Streptomyces kronopolitis]
MYDHVFRAGCIGTMRLPHRIVMGAMHLNLETADDDGAALAAFYAERAAAGAALIVTGGVAVNAVGAGGPGYGVIGDSRTRAALSAAVRAVHERGGRIALQLFHAGRYALPGAREGAGHPVAPSPVHSAFARCTPREMSPEEITTTIADFAEGASAARALGFDAVEVMGSEGYLINQFTAPLTNLRDDAWGGDAARRRRFPLEVLRAVRAAVGRDFPVLFRISGNDLVTGGTPPDEITALAVALAEAGADALSVGVGWHESPVPTVQSEVPAGTWAACAKALKRALLAAGHTDVAVIAANRFPHLAQADEALSGGELDFVAMARPFLADPQIVAKSAAGRPDRVNVCIACNEACIDRSFGTERVSCLVNPRAGYETEFPPPQPTRHHRGPLGRYAVIGAGIAGLEAARTLAGLGHQVEVYEAAAHPGGQFRLASRVPGKAEFAATIHHHVRELRDAGVPLHLGRRLGSADIPELRSFDGVVLATGVRPAGLTLSGADLPHVRDYAQAFADPEALGGRIVVIGGGGIAVDLAHTLTTDPAAAVTPEEFLARHAVAGGTPRPGTQPAVRGAPCEVTLIRRGRRIGAGIGPSTRWVVMRNLRAAGVRMLTGVTYRKITPTGVLVTDAEGSERSLDADHVVLAVGQAPVDELAPLLHAAGVPVVTAGGAAGTDGLNAVRATAEGLRAAHRISRVAVG